MYLIYNVLGSLFMSVWENFIIMINGKNCSKVGQKIEN